jgi:hypothetical protein
MAKVLVTRASAADGGVRDSFDRFVAEAFDNELDDFRAVMDGRENPQGYYD